MLIEKLSLDYRYLLLANRLRILGLRERIQLPASGAVRRFTTTRMDTAIQCFSILLAILGVSIRAGEIIGKKKAMKKLLKGNNEAIVADL